MKIHILSNGLYALFKIIKIWNNFEKVPDNPQEQGITVAPLNVDVWYRSAGARRKSYLFPTTKVSQVLVDYALNKFK